MTGTDYDVVITGGGPAGCSAGLFTARYGLDTVIFDRGRSSLQQCAFLENYLGFPEGIDINTFYDLIHDHAEETGCEIIPDIVETVHREDGVFHVDVQEGDTVTANRVIAATRYGGEYLRPFDDGSMFETHDHGGEEHEHFDYSYTDTDGRTPVENLYVASPSAESDHQVIIAAGRGARVGQALIKDIRQASGIPESVSDQYDWARREAELTDEWRERDRWREWAKKYIPDEYDIDEAKNAELLEEEIDRRLDMYLSADTIEQYTERGHNRLLEHIDDDRVLERAREIEAERQSAEAND